MKKIVNGAGRVLAFLLCLAVILAVALYPRKSEEAVGTEKRVVRIWNVDTFEGGKGSRTAFLKRAARLVEKQREGVYFLVSSYTREGALEAAARGELPDLLSFGIGLDVAAEKSLPISYSFAGGELNGKSLAYPWCRGAYALFSLDGFEGEGETVISNGGCNLPEVAAALADIRGTSEDSLTAYVKFCGGEYKYLLGTQRDYCRLTARGLSFSVKPLNVYCDLFQYISVLSGEKNEDCIAFVDTLLSGEVQAQLSSIGMSPVKGEGELFGEPIERTVSAFSSAEALQNLKEITQNEGKNIAKYLKNIPS